MGHQIIEPAPRTFDLLKLRRMNDLVHLCREILIQLRDHLLKRVDHVGLDKIGVRERLSDQSADGVLKLGSRPLCPWFEALLQKRSKLIGVTRLDQCFGRTVCCCFRLGRHRYALQVINGG